jgi:hypothetical protein
MSAINPIPSVKFARLIGTSMCPALIDVRVDGGGAMVTTLACFGTRAVPVAGDFDGNELIDDQ